MRLWWSTGMSHKVTYGERVNKTTGIINNKLSYIGHLEVMENGKNLTFVRQSRWNLPKSVIHSFPVSVYQ